jgi:hypothetical protein
MNIIIFRSENQGQSIPRTESSMNATECKKNIPVMHNGQKYYLTACGILRKDETKATKCSYKINHFKTKKFLVFKLNKLIRFITRNSTNTTISTIENFFNLLSENSLETFQTS